MKSPYSGVVKEAIEQRRKKEAALWSPNLSHKERNMKKTFAAMMTLGMALAFSPQAKADAGDHKTLLTVHRPIQVPGAILEPGRYVMKLYGSLVHRHIVQIASDEGQVVATVFAVPVYGQTVPGTPKLTFWEVPDGQPAPLRSWFFPGDATGHELIYHDGFLNNAGAKSAAVQTPGAGSETAATEKSGSVLRQGTFTGLSATGSGRG